MCLFTTRVTKQDITNLTAIAKKLEEKHFTIQTTRICSQDTNIKTLLPFDDGKRFLSLGTVPFANISSMLKTFYESQNISFNIDITKEDITDEHVALLFDVIRNNPKKTFNLTFVCNNLYSSPFFPSATYASNGFSIGLQTPDLSSGCASIDEWLKRTKDVWNEICELFVKNPQFIGIDSSVAPLFKGSSSFVDFIDKLGISFPDSVTTEIYTTITKFIKTQNPKPVGLCGLMFPALEDFELANQYEKGQFSIERNLFLSLHSGLGIDTYPIGINESKEKILHIFKLTQALSNKYKKPLSIRFVSDGKAKVGQKTDFKNIYLKDVVIRAL